MAPIGFRTPIARSPLTNRHSLRHAIVALAMGKKKKDKVGLHPADKYRKEEKKLVVVVGATSLAHILPPKTALRIPAASATMNPRPVCSRPTSWRACEAATPRRLRECRRQLVIKSSRRTTRL